MQVTRVAPRLTAAFQVNHNISQYSQYFSVDKR